jgi:hypothetical protein
LHLELAEGCIREWRAGEELGDDVMRREGGGGVMRRGGGGDEEGRRGGGGADVMKGGEGIWKNIRME